MLIKGKCIILFTILKAMGILQLTSQEAIPGIVTYPPPHSMVQKFQRKFSISVLRKSVVGKNGKQCISLPYQITSAFISKRCTNHHRDNSCCECSSCTTICNINIADTNRKSMLSYCIVRQNTRAATTQKKSQDNRKFSSRSVDSTKRNFNSYLQFQIVCITHE